MVCAEYLPHQQKNENPLHVVSSAGRNNSGHPHCTLIINDYDNGTFIMILIYSS